MKNLKLWLTQMFVGVLLFVWGFTAGYFLYPVKHPASTPHPAPAQIDTVKIQIPADPVVVIKHVPGKMRLDTVRIYGSLPNHDESFGYAAVKVACLDTTVDDYGHAFVDYFFPPVNKFDFKFDPFPRVEQTIVKTVYVPQVVYKQKWYQKDWLWFAAGSAATFLVADHFSR